MTTDAAPGHDDGKRGVATTGAAAETGGVDAWLAARQRETDALLDAHLPQPRPGDDPGRLVEAMRYSLLAPGKRLRPLLALAAAEAVGAPLDEPVRIAAGACELVHCYSLVHDDLPAMDDDDIRRGRPTNHKVFGDATAILAGDALLTLAFDWLAEAGEAAHRPQPFLRAVLALARGAGHRGMVRGQARDLGEPAPTSLDVLERLHAEKTAALFRAAAEVGAAAGGAGPDEIEALGAFGFGYGIAFQHADDLDDADHPTYAGVARTRILALLADASAALGRLRVPARASILRALAARLSARAQGNPPFPR